MAKNGTSNKYDFIDYYLLDNLGNRYKNKECKKKIFNEKNFFLSTKNNKGIFCQNAYIKNYLRIIMILL